MQLFSRSVLVTASLALAAVAQQVQAPYDTTYAIRGLGAVPGVPQPYGGVTIKYDDPDVLLIAGDVNSQTGAIYAVPLTRDADGRITGFAGDAIRHADAPFIDGGLAYGPDNVLFYTTYPNNELGQIFSGASAPARITQLGLPTSAGSLAFVPPGFPGAGTLKLCGYAGGEWFSSDVAPDGAGTFDLIDTTQTATLTGGPEGFYYVPRSSPQLPDDRKVLVCEFDADVISLMPIDGNGDPDPASRLPFVTGIAGPEGAASDGISGAMIVTSFDNGASEVWVLDGFGRCGSLHNYGLGISGSSGLVPDIRGLGCAAPGGQARIEVGDGPSDGLGVLNLGLNRLNVPIFGGAMLTDPLIAIVHQLDPIGRWSLQFVLPEDPALIDERFYFQAAYLDAAATAGLTATAGVEMIVR